ncbi:MAG TPA: hypothetical protein VK279_14345, partial [Solirubrobacteraceae bacterium]|nr:hypothetical protein [Solirubrobacteraceae bacterium]
MSAARDLAARTRLAFRHRGVAGVARRALSTPIRATPLGSRLFPEPMGEEHEKAVEWFAEHGRPVTVLVPVAAGRREAGATLRSVKRTTRGLPVTVRPVRGGPSALDAALRTAAGDAVVLQPEVIVHGGWLEMLQEAAYKVDERAAVSARELDGEGRVVSVGVGRDPRRPGAFSDRYAGRPADHPPAEADVPVLAPSAGCLYLRGDALDRLGALDPELTGPWAPVDFGLRAWNAGLQVISHAPVSVTRLGTAPARGEDDRFWERWGAWLDARDVRSPSGGLRIAYVTEDTGIGGGHRVVFEHLNRLAARGHEPVLFALDGPPDWFDL